MKCKAEIGGEYMPKKIVLGLIMTLVTLGTSSFAQIASDNAANYGGGWTNGSNGGTGFTSWALANNNGATVTGGTSIAGNVIESSTTGGSGNIDSSGVSFGIYATPAGSFSTATRSFAEGDLLSGQTFTFQLAVNFRSGQRGFNLDNGGTQLFNFNVGNVGNGDDYTYKIGSGSAISLGLDFQSDSVFRLSFTPTTGTLFNVQIARTTAAHGTETTNLNGIDLGAAANTFAFYISDTPGGAQQNSVLQ